MPKPMTASFLRMCACYGIQLHPESNNITRLQSTATAKKHVDACWNCFIQGDLVLFQRRFCCSGDPDSVSWSEWGEKARPLHAWICNPYFSRNDWLIINHLQHQRKTNLWFCRRQCHSEAVEVLPAVTFFVNHCRGGLEPAYRRHHRPHAEVQKLGTLQKPK